MPLEQYSRKFLPAIEATLQEVVARTDEPGLSELHAMLSYHMGWQGPGMGLEARGKRIRPVLVLLTASAAGGDWELALPAAAAVELVHNFSLIHDDIQDGSRLRRGRPTLWSRWGVAQAINAGDAMFSLAHLTLLRLGTTVSSKTALNASDILLATCLALTQGQYLDLAYESRGDLTLESYWPMVAGKTAALISACTQLGALTAQADSKTCDAYYRFGRNLGFAFQVRDDLLGIWGDAALTGKSAESDLLSGKKSLPVLYGLSLEGDFSRRWKRGPVEPGDVPELAAQLEGEGARAYTRARADELTSQALAALEEANPSGEAGIALSQLANKLLSRQM